jgi:hypothetical protein
MTTAAILPTAANFRAVGEAGREHLKNAVRWHACALEANPARRLEIFRRIDDFAEEAASQSAIQLELLEIQ